MGVMTQSQVTPATNVPLSHPWVGANKPDLFGAITLQRILTNRLKMRFFKMEKCNFLNFPPTDLDETFRKS